MIRDGVLLSLALIATSVPALGIEPLTGRASVIDADTIEIHGTRVRFDGIDAVESGQRCTRAGAPYLCGKVAARELDRFLAASRPTTCELTGGKSWERWIATCFRADGKNVSAWLVYEGWALPHPRYAKGRYRQEERSARGARRGVWNGEFEKPWDWR